MSQEQQQIFPYLQRLLNGAPVEWKPLGEVVKVIRGKSLKKSDVGLGDTPIILYGELYTTYGDYIKSIVSYTSFETAKTASIAHKTDILLPISSTTKEAQIGKASVLCVDSDIYVGGDALILRHSQNAGYLMYLLNCSWFERLKMRCVKGTTIMHLSPPQLMKIPIPIPPMEVQERIVEILDKFTELQAELQAELALREKQYIYFRDQLLSKDKTERPIRWTPLGKVGSVCMCKRILKNQTSETSGIPFYKIGTFGGTPNAYISKELFERYKAQYSYPNKGDILLSASGTIGRTVIYDGEDAYFQDSNIVWIDHNEETVLNKYLYYCYQIADWRVSKGGTIARLYNKNLLDTTIPIPFPDDKNRSLEEQERIVGILDRFETMVHSIKEGLPREIELRRKQYEYFRDQLLTFPKG